jgi:TP901 family phage tail tape measure protein
MARGFNLTAELNLRGPSNIRTIVADIRRQLGTINANVNVRLDPGVARNIGVLNQTFRAFNNTLHATNTSANATAISLRTLGTAIQQVNNRASNLPANLEQINNATQNVAQQNAAATAAVHTTTSAFREFGQQSALAVRRFAAFATVTGVIYKVSSAISSATTDFITFNQELVRVSQVTDTSVNNLSGLVAEITNLSTRFGVSSNELIKVSSTLAQAGLSARDTEKALKALALSALAPSFDNLNSTVEGSIALMRQFGISAGELDRALGSVNAVAAKFAVEAGDIITAIQRTGGVFATASKGVSEGTQALNEFMAVFTSVRATTRESAETIATGLRTIFTRIQRGDTIDALKEYGVTLTDLQGKFVGPYEAVRRLSQGLSQLDPRDLKFSRIVEELGGFRQIGKVIPLIQQFATAQAALKVAQSGQDSLATDAAIAQQSLAIQMAKVRNEFVGLVRSIGQSSGFQSFVKLSLDLTSNLIRLTDAAKGALPALGAIFAMRGLSAIGQFGRGFIGGMRPNRNSEGGPIRHFAAGGHVPGSGGGDTIPAMLSAGEFVMSRPAVQSIGVGNLSAMNKGGSIAKRYASGGPVGSFGGGVGNLVVRDNNNKDIGLANDIYEANIDKAPIIIKSIIRNQQEKSTAAGVVYNGRNKQTSFNPSLSSDAKFEKIAKQVTGGRLISTSNYPIDIEGTDHLYEVKYKEVPEPDIKIAKKSLLYYLTKNTPFNHNWNRNSAKKGITVGTNTIPGINGNLTPASDRLVGSDPVTQLYPEFRIDPTKANTEPMGSIINQKNKESKYEKYSGGYGDTLARTASRMTQDAQSINTAKNFDGAMVDVSKGTARVLNMTLNSGGLVQRFGIGGNAQEQKQVNSGVAKKKTSTKVTAAQARALLEQNAGKSPFVIRRILSEPTAGRDFAQILKKQGVTIPPPPKFLGSGISSMVWDIGKGKVLKVSLKGRGDNMFAENLFGKDGAKKMGMTGNYQLPMGVPGVAGYSSHIDAGILSSAKQDKVVMNIKGRKKSKDTKKVTEDLHKKGFTGIDIRDDNVGYKKQEPVIIDALLVPHNKLDHFKIGGEVQRFAIGGNAQKQKQANSGVAKKKQQIIPINEAFSQALLEKISTSSMAAKRVLRKAPEAAKQLTTIFNKVGADPKSIEFLGSGASNLAFRVRQREEKEATILKVSLPGYGDDMLIDEFNGPGTAKKLGIGQWGLPTGVEGVAGYFDTGTASSKKGSLVFARQRELNTKFKSGKDEDKAIKEVEARLAEQGMTASDLVRGNVGRDFETGEAKILDGALIKNNILKRVPEFDPERRFKIGGEVQRFMAGDVVEPPATTDVKSSAGKIIRELGLKRAAEVGGISAAEVRRVLNQQKEPTEQEARAKALILAEFTKEQKLKASANKGSQTRRRNAATAKGLVFGVAGLFGNPLTATGKPLITTIQHDSLKDKNKQYPVKIYSGIYKNQEEAIDIDAGFDEDIAISSDRAAKRSKKLEMLEQKKRVRGILGGFKSGRELNLDFDKTLAFGAMPVRDPNSPRFSEFSDETKVSAALAKAKLSVLGRGLVSLVGKKPELLKSVRIITARPAATLPLLQTWLTSKGLPIQAGQFKGFGGTNVSGSDIAKLKAAALNPGSIFVDDDRRNKDAAEQRANEGIDVYRYRGVKKLKDNTQPLEESEAVKGGLLEGYIRRLGAVGSKKGNGFDFMNGLGPDVAKKFKPRIPSRIPTDIKRTIVGLSTVKDNIVTYLKNVKGYNNGGAIQRFATGGSSQPKDTLEKYFTDAAPINLGLSNSKALSKDQRKQLASDTRDLRQLRTPAPRELYSSISRSSFDTFAMDTGLNKNPDIPQGTKFNNRQSYYASEVAKTVGKTFSLPGFVSTSKDYPVAKSFLDNAPRSEDNWAAMLTIATKKKAQGVDVAEQLKDRKINVTKQDINPRTGKMDTFFMKQPSEENEFMLSPRSRFRVAKARYVDLMGRHNLWADVQQYAVGGNIQKFPQGGMPKPTAEPTPTLIQRGGFKYSLEDIIKAGFTEAQFMKQIPVPGGYGEQWQIGGYGEGSIPMPPSIQPYKARPSVVAERVAVAQAKAQAKAQERTDVSKWKDYGDTQKRRRHALGGLIQKFSQGGVPKPRASSLKDIRKATGFADGGQPQKTVLALVSREEAYVPPEIAKDIGLDKLREMNQADRNGMKSFARGGVSGVSGVSVFKGPGSDTSDSIGPIELPIGSFILRAAATRALGLSGGGSVGVQQFASGGAVRGIQKFNRGGRPAPGDAEARIQKVMMDLEMFGNALYEEAFKLNRSKGMGYQEAREKAQETARVGRNEYARDKAADPRGPGFIGPLNRTDRSDVGAASARIIAQEMQKASRSSQQVTQSSRQTQTIFQAVQSVASKTAGAITTGVSSLKRRFMGPSDEEVGNMSVNQRAQYENKRNRRASYMNTGLALAFAAPMVSEAAGAAFGGSTGKGVAAGGTALGGAVSVGAQFGPIGIVAGAFVGLALAMDSFHKAVIEADIDLSKKKIETSATTAEGQLEKLNKNPRDAALTSSIVKNFKDISAEEEKISAKQAELRQPSMLTRGLETASFGMYKASRPTNEQIAEEQTANQKVGGEIALKTLTAKVESGLNIEQALSSFGGDKDLAKLNIAQTNKKFNLENQKLENIKKTPGQDPEIIATIEKRQKELVDVYFKEETATQQATVAERARVTALQQSARVLNLSSVSIAKTFENMDQAIDSATTVLDRASQRIDDIASGQASLKTQFQSTDVLKNPNAYSQKERQAAVGQVSGMFGKDQNFVEGLSKFGSSAEDTITKISVKAQQTGAIGEVLGENITRDLTKQLIDTFGDNRISDAIRDQLKNAVQENIKSNKGVLDPQSLIDSVGGLKQLIDSQKKAFDTMMKQYAFIEKALDTYGNAVQKAAELQTQAVAKFASLQGYLADSRVSLREALGEGRRTSLSERSAGRYTEAAINAGVKPGSLTAANLTNQRNNLLNQRSAVENNTKKLENSGNLADPAVISLIAKQKDALASLNRQIEATEKGLDGLPDLIKQDLQDTLSKIGQLVQERESRTQAGASFGEKLVTSTPTELNNLNATYDLLNRTLNGQITTIHQSVSAQQAYRKTIQDGGTHLEAMTAAQDAFAGDAKNAFSLFNEMIQVSGLDTTDKQRANSLRADLIQNTARAQGLNVENNPFLKEILANLRAAPKEDPQIKALENLYKQQQMALGEATQRAINPLLEKQGQILNTANTALISALDRVTNAFRGAQGRNQALGLDRPGAVMNRAQGGPVYAAGGTLVNYEPRGTDTVPAMLTPGEFVINKQATQRNLPLLKSINAGNYAKGGVVYLAGGGGTMNSVVDLADNWDPIVSNYISNYANNVRTVEEMASAGDPAAKAWMDKYRNFIESTRRGAVSSQGALEMASTYKAPQLPSWLTKTMDGLDNLYQGAKSVGASISSAIKNPKVASSTALKYVSSQAAKAAPYIRGVMPYAGQIAGPAFAALSGAVADPNKTGRNRAVNTVLAATTATGYTMGDVGAHSNIGKTLGVQQGTMLDKQLGNFSQLGLTTGYYMGFGLDAATAGLIAASSMVVQDTIGLQGDANNMYASNNNTERMLKNSTISSSADDPLAKFKLNVMDRRDAERLAEFNIESRRLQKGAKPRKDAVGNLMTQAFIDQQINNIYDSLDSQDTIARPFQDDLSILSNLANLIFSDNDTKVSKGRGTSVDNSTFQAAVSAQEQYLERQRAVSEEVRIAKIEEKKQAAQAAEDRKKEQELEKQRVQARASSSVFRMDGRDVDAASIETDTLMQGDQYGLTTAAKQGKNKVDTANRTRNQAENQRQANRWVRQPATPGPVKLKSGQTIDPNKETQSLNKKKKDKELELDQYSFVDPADMTEDQKKDKERLLRERDQINSEIIKLNNAIAVDVPMRERDQQWKMHGKKQEQDANKAEIASSNRANAKRFRLELAVGQAVGMGAPNKFTNPEAFIAWRGQALSKLKRKFNLTGSNKIDEKLLTQYGLSAGAAQDLFHPFTPDQAEALIQAMSQEKSGGNYKYSDRDISILRMNPDQIEALALRINSGDTYLQGNMDERKKLEKAQEKTFAKLFKNFGSIENMASRGRGMNIAKQAMLKNNIAKQLTKMGYINPQNSDEDNAARLAPFNLNNTVGFLYPQVAAGNAAFRSSGGMIYASEGKLINYQPRGTDTVPAMLTPGEFVVNAKSTSQNLPLLQAINKSKGGPVYLQQGGVPQPLLPVEVPTNRDIKKFASPIGRKAAKDIINNANMYDIFNNDMLHEDLDVDAKVTESKRYIDSRPTEKEKSRALDRVIEKIKERSYYVDQISKNNEQSLSFIPQVDLSQKLFGITLNDILEKQADHARQEYILLNQVKNQLTPTAPHFSKGGVVYAQDGFDPSRPLNPMMNRHGKGPTSTLPQQPITNFDNEKLAEEGKAFIYGAAKSVLPGLAGLGAGVLGLPTTGPGGFAVGLGAGAAVYQAQENYLKTLAPETNRQMKDTTEEHWQASLLGSIASGFGVDKAGRKVLSPFMKNTLRMPATLPNNNASVRPDMKSAGQEAMEEFSLRSRPGIQAPSLLNESKPEGLLGRILDDFQQKNQPKLYQPTSKESPQFFDNSRAVVPLNKNRGGVIYASRGTLVNYQPRGTDTIPAMLTPGEFVVNARSTAQHLPLLQSINGGANHMSRGGMAYLSEGGIPGVNNGSILNLGQIFTTLSQSTQQFTKGLQLAISTLSDYQKQLSSGPTNSVSNNTGSNNLNMDGLSQFTNTFNKFIGQLAELNLPPQIKIEGTHKVDVVINGASVFANMEGSIRGMIVREVEGAMNKLAIQTEGVLRT